MRRNKSFNRKNEGKPFLVVAIVFGLLFFYANSGSAPEGDDPLVNLKINRDSGSPLFNFPILPLFNTGGGGGSTVPPVDNTTTPDPITPDPIVRPLISADFRNAFINSWRGTACDNLRYAKSMGYDYIDHQKGMNNCPGAKDIKFLIGQPEESLTISQWRICYGTTYTSAQISAYNKEFMWRSDDAFPNNLATGWFFSSDCFRPIVDFQQQANIDNVIAKTFTTISSFENNANNFVFGGYWWDVPALGADLWNGLQSTGGKQVDIDDWTGSCSAILHSGITHDYSCADDGKAAFLKKLFSETRKKYPDMKIITEPYYIYNDWVREINSRSDKCELMPDLILAESRNTQFITDSRNFICGLTFNDVGYTAVDVKTDRTKTYLTYSSIAAINGAWAGYGGRLADSSMGYNNIMLFPNKDKMVKVFPNWDNLYQVPLSDRSWSSSTLKYVSTNSYADMNIIYSRHPKNYDIYVVYVDGTIDKKILLNNGEIVKDVYEVNDFFERTNVVTSQFEITSDYVRRISSLLPDKAYIIEVE